MKTRPAHYQIDLEEMCMHYVHMQLQNICCECLRKWQVRLQILGNILISLIVVVTYVLSYVSVIEKKALHHF